MGKWTVKITQAALAGMEGIYDYIADVLLAPENAMGQYNRIADAILTLESNPERCPVFETEPERSWEMRSMVVDNYLVCYIVDPDKVTVTDVLYGASNVHARLKARSIVAAAIMHSPTSPKRDRFICAAILPPMGTAAAAMSGQMLPVWKNLSSSL